MAFFFPKKNALVRSGTLFFGFQNANRFRNLPKISILFSLIFQQI